MLKEYIDIKAKHGIECGQVISDNLPAIISDFYLEDFNMIFKAVAELIAEHTDRDVSEISMESSFKDLGIDSLDTVEMLMNLEDKIGKEIELDRKVETVGDLVRFIEEKCKD